MTTETMTIARRFELLERQINARAAEALCFLYLEAGNEEQVAHYRAEAWRIAESIGFEFSELSLPPAGFGKASELAMAFVYGQGKRQEQELNHRLEGEVLEEADSLPLTTLLIDEIRKSSRTLPAALVQWAADDWVFGFLADAGIRVCDLGTADPDKPITGTGNSLLNLAAMCPYRPSLEVSMEVMRYFLEERGASPNMADHYGRTALAHFCKAGIDWSGNPEFGVSGIRLLLKHGADANVLFAPTYMSEAKCERWRLIHHCRYASSLWSCWEITREMLDLLSPHWDETLTDSEGRTVADYEQIPRVAHSKKMQKSSLAIQERLKSGQEAWALLEEGILEAKVQVLYGSPGNPNRFMVRAANGKEEWAWSSQLQLIQEPFLPLSQAFLRQ